MAKKHYPVQKRISVTQPSPVANVMRIQTPKLLSQVNHRLYRQSRVYECAVQIDANVADATTVDVFALADTWYLHGALKLAKSAWDKSNEEEIMMNNGKVARWNDFRVNHNVAGSSDAIAVQFDQNTLVPGNFTAGQFDFSRVVDQAGTNRSFVTGGAGVTTYNIFDEYDNQAGTSSDPEIPSTGPYSGLLPNLEAGAATAISEFGSEPPYSADGYGNNIWVKVGTLHLASGRQRLSTGFFSAPLGAICLTGVAFLTEPDIQVTVKGGDYKGVHASSMLE